MRVSYRELRIQYCVVIMNQSQYSLTDLAPPPCELSNYVIINLLERSLQEIRVSPRPLVVAICGAHANNFNQARLPTKEFP